MRLSAVAKVLNKQPKENSKTQLEKKAKLKENPTKYIACKNCHQTNVTLIKGKDSYYCKFCYNKLMKKGN